MSNLRLFQEGQFLRAEELNQILQDVFALHSQIERLETNLKTLETNLNQRINNLEAKLQDEQLQQEAMSRIQVLEQRLQQQGETINKIPALEEKQTIIEALQINLKEYEAKITEQQEEIDILNKKLELVGKKDNIQAKPVFTQSFQEQYINLGNGITMEFIVISGGDFIMGSDKNENENPPHGVTIKPFLMGKTLVTQAQWKAIMKNNPSFFEGDNLPVERVNWKEAVKFGDKISEKTGKKFRLPTEAEWEYACRAGSKTSYYFGEDSNQLKNYAWYKDNSKDKTHPVMEKTPNAWGLYDMHGNVWEFCSDFFEEGDGKKIVIRGGAWNSPAEESSSSHRNNCNITRQFFSLGLRLVLEK